jgi:RimJ/RimL family protein N-acetyltransferase
VTLDTQPVLKGELLSLRPLREEDYDSLYDVARDPLIWEQHPASDRYQPDVFREFFRDAMASGGALIATDTATGAVIGSSRYFAYDEARRDVEIGWSFLARSHWGGRYNGEMKRLMLTHAFKSVDTVFFLVSPRNVRSQRAVERLGGVRAGMRNDPHGRESIVYALTPAAYAAAVTPSAPARDR